MGIEIYWYDEAKTVFIYAFKGQWTVQDIYDTFPVAHDMTVHIPAFSIIYDVRQSGGVPANLLSCVSFLSREAQDNVTARVFVGESKYPKLFLNIIKNFVPQVRQNVYYTATIEEAVAILHRSRQPVSHRSTQTRRTVGHDLNQSPPAH